MQSESYKREYTNEFVARWDALIGWKGRAEGEKGFFERILERCNCRRVADIASGTGFHAIRLANAGFDVVATDGSPNMVRKTEQNARRIGVDLEQVRVVDWRQLDQVLERNSFDALICLGNAFTHLFDEQARRRSLEAIWNVLKPGGIVIMDHRNYDKILDQGYSSKHRYYYVGDGVDARPVEINDKRVRFEYSYPDGERFHLTLFPLRQDYITRLLKESGFTNIERYGDFVANFESEDVDFVQLVAFKPRT